MMTLAMNRQIDRRPDRASLKAASRWLGLLGLMVLLSAVLASSPARADDKASKFWFDFGVELHQFDVAENATRFVFDDGLPAYGNPFITQGYIYPYGFLDDNEGVTQLYDFGERAGELTLISEGSELVDLHTPIKRFITGGTGRFRNARGEGEQVLLGFNQAEGVNLRFKLKVKIW